MNMNKNNLVSCRDCSWYGGFLEFNGIFCPSCGGGVYIGGEDMREYEGLYPGQLVYNAIRTPDGTVLSSKYRHDYVDYVDSVDGLNYMVDGGLDYCRRSVKGEDLCVVLGDGHEKVREVLEWGSYGIKGDEPLKTTTLKDMSTNHIKAVIKNCFKGDDTGWRKQVMLFELEYRS